MQIQPLFTWFSGSEENSLTKLINSSHIVPCFEMEKRNFCPVFLVCNCCKYATHIKIFKKTPILQCNSVQYHAQLRGIDRRGAFALLVPVQKECYRFQLLLKCISFLELFSQTENMCKCGCSLFIACFQFPAALLFIFSSAFAEKKLVAVFFPLCKLISAELPSSLSLWLGDFPIFNSTTYLRRTQYFSFPISNIYHVTGWPYILR